MFSNILKIFNISIKNVSPFRNRQEKLCTHAPAIDMNQG